MKTLYIPLKEAAYINVLLAQEPKDETEYFPEGKTLVYAVDFGNSYMMHVMLVGVEYQDGADNRPYTVATLLTTVSWSHARMLRKTTRSLDNGGLYIET